VLNERSQLKRKPLLLRISSIYVLVPLCFALSSFLAMIFVLNSPIFQKPFVPPGPLMKLLEVFTKSVFPLIYMTWPPSVPERERLMAVSSDGLRRPTSIAQNSGRSRKGRWWVLMVFEITLLLWCMVSDMEIQQEFNS
jgi:hypothetical protein